MIKRSKVWVAAFLAANMAVSQPAMVLAQDVPAESEDVVIEEVEESEEVEDSAKEAFTESEDAIEDVISDEEVVLEEYEAIEEEADLEEVVTAGGLVLSAEQKTFRNDVIAHFEDSDIDSLEEGRDYVADEVLTIASSEENARAIAAAYHGTLKEFEYGIATISLDDSDYTVAEAYSAGVSDDYILPAVEPNYVTTITDPVNTYDIEGAEFEAGSVFSPYDWSNVYYDMGINDPALNPANDNVGEMRYQWFHDMINTYPAWAVTTGSPDVVVAVIDTGVRSSHEELSGKVIVPTDFKLNYANNQDNVGHGTHVAAIIAGKKENGAGGAGVAPDVKILAINASSYSEEYKNYVFTDEDEAKSILYVAGYNADGQKVSEPRADIINMSIGGLGYSAIVDNACKKAIEEAKVTTIAAMGNSYANSKQFPAAYDNVISVAAVDPSGAKTDFSNWGGWCEIAAPGVTIYSANADSDSSYVAWGGTSMATPVVAGACALYMSVYGHVDPEQMVKVLQSSVSKSSSKGVGAGIVDLAKMFGGDVAAPTITVTDKDGKVLGKAEGDTLTVQGAQSIDTLISVMANNFDGSDELNANTKIAFSMDGKDPALKNELLTHGYYIRDYASWHNTARKLSYYFGESSKERNVTIKFATITGMGVMSKVSTVKLTIEGTEDKGWGISIEGQNAVPKGTSATYKTAIYGSAVTNKKLTVDIDDVAKGKGATFVNGKVTIPAVCDLETFTLTVTSEQNPLWTASRTINVSDLKVNSVVINAIDPLDLNKISKNKKTNSVTAATLYNVNIDGEGFEADETKLWVSVNYLSKTGDYVSHSSFRMMSSNSRVAYPTYDEKGYSYIKAVSPGTAKITFEALDGSKKKATVKVKVITPASHLNVKTKDNQSIFVSLGKSVTTQAIVGAAYGKPTNSKVKWSYKIYGIYNDTVNQERIYSDPISDSDAKAVMRTKAFSFSGGKLKVSNYNNFQKAFKYIPEGYMNGIAFEAIAQTTDGTGYSDSVRYIVAPPTTYIKAYAGVDKDGNPIGNAYELWYMPFTGDGNPLNLFIASNGAYQFEVTSSNPDIISCEMSGTRLLVMPHKTGTATVKLKALDGSKKTLTLTMKVLTTKEYEERFNH